MGQHIGDIGDISGWSKHLTHGLSFMWVNISEISAIFLDGQNIFTRFIFCNMWVNISEISAIFLDGQNIIHTVYLLPR